MELYVGGRCQGKLAYVLRKKGLRDRDVAEGASAGRQELAEKKILNHAQLWIRRLLEESGDVPECEAAARELMERRPELIWVADEIGCGIVPLERKERVYRETAGRILCEAAKRCSHMERIICGVGQVLKEEGGGDGTEGKDSTEEKDGTERKEVTEGKDVTEEKDVLRKKMLRKKKTF